MRTLILGAGVIGSFNAARLTESGQDITLLARGRRLEDLREHGVVLEDFRTGRRTITQVQLVDRLGPRRCLRFGHRGHEKQSASFHPSGTGAESPYPECAVPG